MIPKQIELFEALTNEQMEALLTISVQKTYKAGNILFYEGERPHKLHLLLDGIVKVYKTDARGNELVMHYFQPQTLIAETAHMQKIAYPATAVGETDCLLLEIDYAAFEKDFLRNPEISLKIIQSLSTKVKTLQNVITTNLTMNTFCRTCKFLCENEHLLGSLSQRKIAMILNLTPETLSRNIAVLKKEGAVMMDNRKLIVLDKARLCGHVDSCQ